MAFKIELFGSNTSNVKNMFGGTNDYRYYNKDNNTLTTPGYFPGTLGLEVGDRIRVTPSVKTNPDEIYIVTDITGGVVTVTQVDTDGAVDSVNGKTGNVVLTAQDVLPSQTDFSGRVLGTDGFVAGWVKPEVVQRSTMPQASEEEVDKIYQFTGTTDASYTNGYFYKCVSDGQNPTTYSWEQVDVMPAPDALPAQTGNAGKFLTTDGTDASWATINALQNTATGNNSLTILGTATTGDGAVNIGVASVATGASVSVGRLASVTGVGGVGIGEQVSVTGRGAVGIGNSTTAGTDYSCIINTSLARKYNFTAGSFVFANNVGSYTLLNPDGTIPAGRIADTTELTAGNYIPRLTIDAQGNKTITWVAE